MCTVSSVYLGARQLVWTTVRTKISLAVFSYGFSINQYSFLNILVFDIKGHFVQWSVPISTCQAKMISITSHNATFSAKFVFGGNCTHKTKRVCF